jgi:hypothetical protein
MKKRNKNLIKNLFKKPLTLGLVVLVSAILILFLNTSLSKLRNYGTGNIEGTSPEGDGAQSKTPEGIEGWEYYVHPEYKFSLYVPELLIKREYDNPGDYLFFVRFEGNRISESRGLAIGVSDRTLEEEEKKIRELIEEDLHGVEPVREDLKLTKYEAIRLDYEAIEGLESRTIILVANGEYTYSISTNPEQMGKVLSGFVFID